jgi:hypothetical protein
MISILDRCRAHAGPETDAKALRKAVTTCMDTPVITLSISTDTKGSGYHPQPTAPGFPAQGVRARGLGAISLLGIRIRYDTLVLDRGEGYANA